MDDLTKVLEQSIALNNVLTKMAHDTEVNRLFWRRTTVIVGSLYAIALFGLVAFKFVC